MGSAQVIRGGAAANCKDLVAVGLLQKVFNLEDVSVIVSFRALTYGGRRIIHLRPAATENIGTG